MSNILTKKYDKKYLVTAPKTRKDLHEYIQRVFGLYIPDKSVCEGHISPYQFVADAYFEKISDGILIAGRATGKTQDFAVIDALNSNFKPNCSTGTVGATKKQAGKCYQYFKKLIQPYKDIGRIESSLMESTKFIHPINSEVEILIGTIEGCNSPHPQKAFLDEFELVDWAVYQEFCNMPIESHGIPAQVILASTRKYSHGTVQKLINDIHNTNYKLYVWCVWESVEKCLKTSCEECKSIVKGEYEDGSPRTFYSVCQEKAKRANGFKKINDVINTFKRLDVSTWEAQQECKKPENKGAVFTWFDETTCSYEDDFDYTQSGVVVDNAIDWGAADPNVCLFVAEKDGHYFIFDEIYEKDMAVSEFRELIKYRRNEWELVGENMNVYCDPSGRSGRIELEQGGLGILNIIPSKNDIQEGISMINSLGMDKRIHIHERCINTLREFREYHYPSKGVSSKPVDKDNHTCDAFKYYILEKDPINVKYDENLTITKNNDKINKYERFHSPLKDYGIIDNSIKFDSLFKFCDW